MTVVEDKSKPFVTSSAVDLDPKPLAPIDPNKYHKESFRYLYVNTPSGAIMCSTSFSLLLIFLLPHPTLLHSFSLAGLVKTSSNLHITNVWQHDQLLQSICKSKQIFVSLPKKIKLSRPPGRRVETCFKQLSRISISKRVLDNCSNV